MKSNNFLVKFIMSFFYAFRGFFVCIKSERNLRIHLVLCTYALYFSTFYSFTKAEIALLIFSLITVSVIEMINTAIEKTVDLITLERNPLAAKIKDISAGAVLVSAITALVVFIILFWDIKILNRIFRYFYGNPLFFALLIISILVSAIFVFLPCILSHNKKDLED